MRPVCASALVAFFLLVMSGVATAAPKRVLLLHSFGQEFAPFSEFSAAFRKDLPQQSAGPIDLYEASIETARFRDSQDEGPLVQYLRALFADRNLDLIVTIGDPATHLLQRYRAQLFPSTPVLIAATEQRLIDAEVLSANETSVGVTINFDRVVDNLLAVLPETTTVAVVIGNSPLERYWVGELRKLFEPLANRVHFLWFNELSHKELLERVASLPPHSAVLYLDVWVDVDGISYEHDKVLTELHAQGDAPIFGYVDGNFGRGIVGGPLLSVSAISRRTAEVATRILGGQTPSDIKTLPFGLGAPEFDARELQRWNIAESRLPAGSIVEFREPTIWAKYRWPLLLTAVVLLAQAVIIGWLLFERRRRRVAELESRQRVLEVIHLNRTVAAGALSASIAHELNQPLGAVQSNADTAELLLAGSPPDIDQVKEILGDIRVANQRAADIIQHFSMLLRRQSEVDLQRFDLNEAIADAVRILSAEAKKRGISLEANKLRQPLTVRADQVHLLQVLLNLALNGMDAMSGVAPDLRKISIQTALAGEAKVEVSVVDSGVGIPKEQLKEVFKSFYTTKQHGTGLGLSIARTIVEAYGGRIWAENRTEGGAVFRFTLPLAEPYPI